MVYHAHTMMLHASLRWPEVSDASLWPMALSYAVYLWNITPSMDTGLALLELFSGSKFDFPLIHNTHVWGCPVYVLDPHLQDGKKLPKWKPRARRGCFVGNSLQHASAIGKILNLTTLTISPQYHIVYDDWFSTIYNEEHEILANWGDLLIHNQVWVLPDDVIGPPLHHEWLDPAELKIFEYEMAQKDLKLVS